jgi:hypothetical protein
MVEDNEEGNISSKKQGLFRIIYCYKSKYGKGGEINPLLIINRDLINLFRRLVLYFILS